MNAADLEALIGPVAPGRVRVVMKPPPPLPPRIHPSYRALLDAPPPPDPDFAPSFRGAVTAAAFGLLVAVLLVALVVTL